jgi:hypothetical protein
MPDNFIGFVTAVNDISTFIEGNLCPIGYTCPEALIELPPLAIYHNAFIFSFEAV